MEKERNVAGQRGLPDPIQPDKNSTDDDFNEALRLCTDHLDRIRFCAGTHNEQSCYLLTQLMEEHHVPANDRRVWFAQLYGMSDNISYNLARAGYNVAKYVPYGPVRSVCRTCSAEPRKHVHCRAEQPRIPPDRKRNTAPQAGQEIDGRF
jgi:proline dehydrogenase